MDNKYLTVSALNKYIKYKFDSDDNLSVVFIKGEISNLKPHTTGHHYFTIKDETSRVNAIMFSGNASKLTFTPTDGMKVLVSGRVSVYEATGNYQIYVDDMQEDGVGNLYLAFEKLKEKLSAEGLFDVNHKRPIPNFPTKIGIVTAATGAAIKDILSTLKRRYPTVKTYLFPSLVQGNGAALDIVNKIKQAQTFDLDVLIVGRGGGSIEDLWPFNEEIVARAIYDSKVPIISAVGHEIDFTISDFVADLRAPTPTAAAELAVPNMADIIKTLSSINIRMNENLMKRVNYEKLHLDSIKNSFVIKNPMVMLDNKRQKLLIINDKISINIKHNIEIQKNKLVMLIDKIRILNPMDILKRGYTLTKVDDVVINSIKKLKPGTNINIHFYDGMVLANILEVKEK